MSAATEPDPIAADPVLRDTAPLSPFDRRALWLEVAVVCSVAVLPNLSNALVTVFWPDVMGAADATAQGVMAITHSAMVCAVVLYIMYRSSSGLVAFGVSRPVWRIDAPASILLALGVGVTWLFTSRVFYPLSEVGSVFGIPPYVEFDFPSPASAVGVTISLTGFALSALAEELSMRAYLITRLSLLMGSPSKSVLLSAAVFASYHAYQGWLPLIDVFFMGVLYGLAFVALKRIWPLAFGHFLWNGALVMWPSLFA